MEYFYAHFYNFLCNNRHLPVVKRSFSNEWAPSSHSRLPFAQSVLGGQGGVVFVMGYQIAAFLSSPPPPGSRKKGIYSWRELSLWELLWPLGSAQQASRLPCANRKRSMRSKEDGEAWSTAGLGSKIFYLALWENTDIGLKFNITFEPSLMDKKCYD